MPRKRKSQKQNGRTNVPGADLLPPTFNTVTSNTRLAHEEKATPGERSDGPTREIQGTVERHRKQAPALGLHEPDHGASSSARKQDSETAISTKSMPKYRTWADFVRANRCTIQKKPLKDIIHERRQKSDEGNPDTEACLPNLGHSSNLGTEVEHPSSTLMKSDTKNLGKNAPSVDTDTRRDIQLLRELNEQKKKTKLAPINLKSLKEFSESFKVPGPIPRDLLPILAKGRLEQERIIAKMELARNVKEEAKPSNEKKASGKLQHLQEDAIIDTTQALESPKDRQVQSSKPAKGESRGSHIKFPETSYFIPDQSSVSLDETLDVESLGPNEMHHYYSNAPVNPVVRPPYPVGPRMMPNGTTQRQFTTLLTPSMMAFQCGLGVIRHYTYPEGTLATFQPLRNLGRGSMAHVEEVYIPPYESFVRKTFLLKMNSDHRLRCRDIIHREIEVMSRLTHMHIVKVIGSYDLEPFTSTILMFPVGDNDLKMFFDELLDSPRGTHEWGKRRQWLRKWVGCLTSAIAYIHGQGICHKDIKPSNIVYKGDTVYLTDFGSCGQFHIEGTTSTAADARTTLVYRAPELFRTGEGGKHGPGTDVFALGLVFLEMKTVYWGTSIQRLREIYAAAASVKSSDNSEFSYGKALTHIHEELGRDTDRSDNKAWPLSSAVILSMLAFERKERPRAVQVLNAIHFESAHDSCVCTTSNATSDFRFPQPENHQEIMSQISDPSAFAGSSMVSPPFYYHNPENMSNLPYSKTLTLPLHDRRQQSGLVQPIDELARLCLHDKLFNKYHNLEQQEAQLRHHLSTTQYPRLYSS